jgi:5-methylcytosine-specific restriction protein A
MPWSAPKPCSYPGCTQLVTTGRCDEHPRVDTFVRDAEVQKLYGRRWRQRRLAQLAKEPWCADCLRANIYTPATDVHHLQRHNGNIELFMTSPLESLCHICHSRKTAREVFHVA